MKYLIRKTFLFPNRLIRLLVFGYQFMAFKRKSKKEKNTRRVRFQDCLMFLNDNTDKTLFDAHYIYHPAWAIRVLLSTHVKEHVDISSTLAFCTMASAVIPIKFYDYRPAFLNLSNLESDKADIYALPFDDMSLDSLSCMHVLEHIGLGRYGDKLDPNGDIKAISELKRVIKSGGNLLVVVPVGIPVIRFNAHRIYDYHDFVSNFNEFELKEFSLIPDQAFERGMIFNASAIEARKQKYGCGCFWFIKK